MHRARLLKSTHLSLLQQTGHRLLRVVERVRLLRSRAVQRDCSLETDEVARLSRLLELGDCHSQVGFGREVCRGRRQCLQTRVEGLSRGRAGG